jgi:hypothetical protein
MSTAPRIAEALAGRRVKRLVDGSYLIPCPVPSHGKGHGDRNPSLRISDGETRVLVHCYSGCDRLDVLDELRRRGLLDDDRGPVRTTAKAAHAPPLNPLDRGREQHRKAAWMWRQRQPLTGTVAETYLRSRDITCALPATLGFLPPRKPEHHPALISAFALPDEPEPGIIGEPRGVEAVHLTLLRPNGSGKADAKPNKVMVGSPGVVLNDQNASLPIVLAPPNDLLAIAITEGIEDALTAHEATGLGAWAAGGAGRMPALAAAIPPYIETVTVYAHPDKAGQDGARSLAAALAGRGIEIFVEGLT